MCPPSPPILPPCVYRISNYTSKIDYNVIYTKYKNNWLFEKSILILLQYK